jgi:hypothetical protein
MDLLRTAVVDITTLVAACHSLMAAPREGELEVHRKLRNRLRRDIRRATVAYIDTLARTRRGHVDDALLSACRVAAEQELGQAIRHQDLLCQIMRTEPGSLDGIAAARQDLWRLAHLTIHLRGGMVALRNVGGAARVKLASALAGRLRRRLRKALVAYARAALRTKSSEGPPIMAARRAALARIGKRGAAEAERLVDIESDADLPHKLLRQGVAKPLSDLATDWQSRDWAADG